MRFAALTLMVVLIVSALCGCAAQKEADPPPPASYDEALMQMAAEEGLTPTEEELAALRAQAKTDAEALQAINEDPGDLEAEYIRTLLEQQLREKLFAQIVATPEETKAWYDVRLAALEKALLEDPGLFKNQQEGYELYGGVPPLFVPDGYVRFKHILVENEKVALAILSQLEAGGDFQALLAKYGEDPGMEQEPYRSFGYLTGPYPSQRDFMEALKAAALALPEVGHYSQVVSSPAGYHIVMLVARLEGRTVPLEEVKDAIDRLLTASKRQQALEAAVMQRVSKK